MFVCTRGVVHCREPIEVLSYKIGVCKVARYDHDDNDDDDVNVFLKPSLWLPDVHCC